MNNRALRILWTAAGAAAAVIAFNTLGFSWWGAYGFAAIMGGVAAFLITSVSQERDADKHAGGPARAVKAEPRTKN